MAEILTTRVTPCGDWFQTFPIDENNYYDITEQEAIALSEHRLKWSKDINNKPILVENEDSADISMAMHGQEILELKQYLFETDYVIIKIEEAIIDGDAELIASRKAEYASVLAQRKSARTRLNELMA